MVSNNLIIYPNPTSNFLKIQWDNVETDSFSATIFDLSGKKIGIEKISNNLISVQKLQKGTYILEIEDKKGKKYSSKFIKE